MSLYQEEADSKVHHLGHDYDLNTLFKIAEHGLIRNVAVNDLKWILDFVVSDPERVKNADLKFPLLVTVHLEKICVLDGAHRLTKAVKNHVKYLPAIYISLRELKMALIE